MVKKRHKLKKSLGGICFILYCANGIMAICSNIIKLYIFNIWSFVTSRKLLKKKKKKTQFFAAKHELSPLDYGQQNSGYERVLSLLHLSINVYHTLKVELPW